MNRLLTVLSRIISLSSIAVMFLLMEGCQKEDQPLPVLTKLTAGEWKEYYWDQEDVIITNQSDWTGIVTQLNTTLKISGNPEIVETTIDFNKYQVLLVFDGIKGSAGYSVDVTNVAEDDANITVSVLHDGPVNPSVKEATQSFVIVKIPNRKKPVVVDHKSVFPRIYPYSIGRGAMNNTFISREDMVITNQEDWTELLTKMNYGSAIDLLTYYPVIDFDKFMIVASFEKRDCSYPCSSSVFCDITDVIEMEANILVTAQNLWVTLAEGYPQPYHIVKIPKSNKPVVFEHK